MTTAAQLRQAIHAAFQSPPPPPGGVIEPGSDDGEAADIRRTLRHRRWTAVPRLAPRTLGGALAWLTIDARRHYVPLWLVASIDDVDVRSSTLFHLMRIAEPAQRDELARYTPAERAAVADFLRWIATADSSEARRADTARPAWA
jgi:hypothetical protein